MSSFAVYFFFTDTPTTEIYTLSLHDALPISHAARRCRRHLHHGRSRIGRHHAQLPEHLVPRRALRAPGDRKSTRLNSSHTVISYAVFCLKKKNRYRELIFNTAT